ncbi:hypothetical protein ACFLZ6_00490, partial [Nanoarchaeota archaeon]
WGASTFRMNGSRFRCSLEYWKGYTIYPRRAWIKAREWIANYFKRVPNVVSKKKSKSVSKTMPKKRVNINLKFNLKALPSFFLNSASYVTKSMCRKIGWVMNGIKKLKSLPFWAVRFILNITRSMRRKIGLTRKGIRKLKKRLYLKKNKGSRGRKNVRTS